MKWFKHHTDKLESQFVSILFSHFGHVGITFFYGIRELYARELKEPGKPVMFSIKDLARKLHTKPKTLLDILTTFPETVWNLSGISPTVSGDILVIQIEEIDENCDDYSRKVRTQSRPKNKIKDIDLEKEHTPLPPQGEVCVSPQKDPEPDPSAPDRETLISPEINTEVKNGYEYLKGLAQKHPNAGNIIWVEGFLSIHIPQVCTERPDFTLRQVMDCWYDTCDAAACAGKFAAGWIKAVFFKKIQEYNPNKQPVGKVRAPTDTRPKWQKLKEARFVENIYTQEKYDLSDYEEEPVNIGGMLYFKHSEYETNVAISELRKENR